MISDFRQAPTSSRPFGNSQGRLCGILLLVVSAFAQGQGQQNNGFNISVNNELSYDNNVLRQQNNQIGSRLWSFSPSMSYGFQAAGGTFTLNYALSHSDYLDSKADTSTSQSLGLSIDEKINNSNRVTVTGTYNYSYEQRGVGFNEGANAVNLSSPTPLVSQALDVKYRLGSDKSKMHFTGTIGRHGSDRSSPQIVNDSRDYTDDLMGAALDYRVGSRTSLVVEWRDQQTSYPRTPIAADGSKTPLDSDEQTYLIGLDLEATSKTSGKLRVGTAQREFKWKAAQWDDAGAAANAGALTDPATATTKFPANSGPEFYWEFSAVWAPRPYSKFELGTRSSTREALGVGSFVRAQDYVFSWAHRWNNRFGSRLDFSTGTDTFEDSNRSDSRKAYSVSLSYDFDKMLSFGLGYRYQQMRSSSASVGYNDAIYYIFANYHRGGS